MGAARESRKSELIFNRVWGEMKSLCNCVWYGKDLLEEAQEHVDSIKENLDKTIEEMKHEASIKIPLKEQNE